MRGLACFVGAACLFWAGSAAFAGVHHLLGIAIFVPASVLIGLGVAQVKARQRR